MPEEINSSSASKTETKPAWWQSWRVLRLPLGIFSATLTAMLLGLLLYNTFFPPPTPLNQNDIDARIVAAMASATPEPANSSLVYQVILPSLVFIQIQGTNEDGEDGFGVGSGIIVNENGDILTSLHVVANATKIEIIFADGTEATAEIINSDPAIDMAVLRPSQPPEIIVPAVLGASSAMHIGDEAYAVGNPLGLTGSMSAGVLSGFDRSVPINDDLRLEGLIQFDAAVNPGNSGGPLLNRNGQVIGIVTALANPNNEDSFTGIGFAVPIGTAVVVASGGGPSY